MENQIAQKIKSFGPFFNNEKEVYIFGTESYSSLQENTELMIKHWHDIPKETDVDVINYHVIFKEGKGFSSSKTYRFATCMTSKGISFTATIQSKGSISKDDAFLQISWSEIGKVSHSLNVNLKEAIKNDNVFFIPNDPTVLVTENIDALNFYSSVDNSILLIPSYYLPNSNVFAQMINEVLELRNSFEKEYDLKSLNVENRLQELITHSYYTEILKFVDDNSKYIEPCKYDFCKTFAYVGLNDLQNANSSFEILKQKKENVKQGDTHFEDVETYYLMSRAVINQIKEKNYDSAFDFYTAKENENRRTKKNTHLISFLDNKININYNQYVENFLNYRYNERRVITISSNEDLYRGELISLLYIEKLPQVEFPISHPKSDTTYVCHPAKNNFYIPIDNYESEFLDDRINEYCYLLQCLGATSIFIENTKDEKLLKEDKSNDFVNFNLQVDNAVITSGLSKLKGLLSKDDDNKTSGVDITSNHDSIGENNQFMNSKLQKEQFLNPSKKPYLPEDLVWFKQEPSWQRIAQQRLSGNLLAHNEFISSAQNQVLKQTEINKLNGELNIVFIKAKGKKENVQKIKTLSQSEEEWIIKVTFKPMEEFANIIDEDKQSKLTLTEKALIIEGEAESLSEVEQNYLDEVLFMLEDDSIIDQKERSMLERIRVKYGITQERAVLLENELINSHHQLLSLEEREYLTELKNILEDEKTIDEKSKRLLTRYSVLLGITEERSIELQTMHFSKN